MSLRLAQQAVLLLIGVPCAHEPVPSAQTSMHLGFLTSVTEISRHT
ncbi:hypothetical protein A2U01_0116465, partial [Trifolium medium]|nr:hypothetical protein [Trifolium medium]